MCKLYCVLCNYTNFMYLIFLGTLKISVCTIVYPLQICIKYYRQKKKKKRTLIVMNLAITSERNRQKNNKEAIRRSFISF